MVSRLTLLVLFVGACHFDTVGRDTECQRLVSELSECAGVDLVPSDCSVLSQDDVRALASAVEGAGCGFLMDALPVDGDLRSTSCRLYGQGCKQSVQAPLSFLPARYPFVLVNGIDVSPLFRWSDRIVDTMADSGQEVFLGTLSPYSSVERRSAELHVLIEEVRAATGADKVNLLCHSFGGLDCRYLVSPNGLRLDEGLAAPDAISRRVASITTIATAHHGTPVADAALGYLPSTNERDALNALATWIGEWFGPGAIEGDAELRASLTSLSELQAAAFNAAIDDAPGVYYQSWAGVSSPYGEALDPALIEAACTPDSSELVSLTPSSGESDYMAIALVDGHDFASEEGVRPGDGLCPVDSGRWGVFRGCIPADHAEQLGQHRLPDVNVRTGFDIARFYGHVATDLAGRGM